MKIKRTLYILSCLVFFCINILHSSEKKIAPSLYKNSGIASSDILKTAAGLTEINILAIRVEFQEDSSIESHGIGIFDLSDTLSFLSIDPPPHNKLYFEDHLEALKRYYERVSGGNVTINYTVYPQGLNDSYVLPNAMAYYGTREDQELQNRRLCKLLEDSFTAADNDAAIDFSQYNSFIVFHAGVGGDFSTNPYYNLYPEDIPSVYLSLSDLEKYLSTGGTPYNGIPVDGGAFHITGGIILPETETQIDETDTVEIGLNGIIAHQFGHRLGLPSLFNTETGRAGIGQFGVMDMGFGNYSGLIPSQPCAWSKVFMGWEEPIIVEKGANIRVYSSLAANPEKIYKVPITAEEYYLLEYRKRDYSGNGLIIEKSPRGVYLEVDDYDYDIPGTGLLIWHVDERIIKEKIDANKVNAEQDRKGVYLEEADGSFDMGEVFEWILPGFPTPANGIQADAFYLGNNDQFTPTTVPSTTTNEGAKSHISIYAISDTTKNYMTFNFNRYYAYEGFPAFTGGQCDGLSPYTADIDGDGKPEIVLVTRDGKVLAWNGENGSAVIANDDSAGYNDYRGITENKKIALFADAGGSVSFSPVGVDFNNDGNPEVVVINDNGELFVWKGEDSDSDGRADLHFYLNTTLVPVSEIYVVKLQSGENALVFGAEGGFINIVDSLGKLYRSFIIPDSDVNIMGAFKTDDVSEYLVAIPQTDGSIVTITGDGNEVFTSFSMESPGKQRDKILPAFPLTFGDIDGQPNLESVVADSTGGVRIWSAFELTSKNNYIAKEFKIDEEVQFISPPSLGDIDGDGFGEIVIRSPRYLHAYKYNGAQMQQFPVIVEWQDTLVQDSAPQTIIASIDEDGEPDIITGSYNGLLLAFRGSGEELSLFPLTVGSNVKSTPCIADLDGDGDSELIAVSDDYYLYVWDFPFAYDEDNIYWNGYLNGMSHAALMKTITAPTPEVPEELLVEKSVYNYPNPAEGNSTKIHFVVSQLADVSVTIYDMSGQIVEKLNLNSQAQPLIDSEVEWRLDGIASGVYSARVEAVTDDGKREHAFCKIAVIK